MTIEEKHYSEEKATKIIETLKNIVPGMDNKDYSAEYNTIITTA